MHVLSGGRWFRLAVAALVTFVVWQIICHFWYEPRLEPAVDTALLGRHMPAASVLAPDAPAGNVAPQKTTTVVVQVYYEALCPDSKTFVVEQLAPAAHALADIIHVVLVPYGKAKTFYHSQPERRAGDPPPVKFACQHGPDECWGNKLHACGIRQADSQTQAVDFATCLMKNYRKLHSMAQQCAFSVGLDWGSLTACTETNAINTDMERYGNMTLAVKPKIDFIPTITVDGSQNHQGDMFDNFKKIVCEAYKARTGITAKNC